MPASDEKVALVDENNHIIGYKLYSQLTDNDRWRIIAVWVENSSGEVLMQQRSFQKKLDPGLWTCAVEGTVTEDDGYLITAIRETAEEIGVTDSTLTPTQLMRYKAVLGERWVQGYRTVVDWPIERFIKQDSEVTQLRWCDKQTVLEEISAGDSKYPRSASVWIELFGLKSK